MDGVFFEWWKIYEHQEEIMANGPVVCFGIRNSPPHILKYIEGYLFKKKTHTVGPFKNCLTLTIMLGDIGGIGLGKA